MGMDEGKKIIGKLLLQSTTAQLFVGWLVYFHARPG